MQTTALRTYSDTLSPYLRDRGLLGHGAAWTALSGGRTNWLWRITQQRSDIVVKLFAGNTKNPLFPNDPASEVLALQHLDAQNIAPRLLDHFPTSAGYCIVYSHLPGNPWHTDVAEAAHMLYRLHQITPPAGLRRAADGSAELRKHSLSILDACPSQRADGVRALEPRSDVVASGQACFLHGDPVPANIVVTPGTMRLIDWQCPATGDPCEDLSVFLSPAMQLSYRGAVLGDDEISAFLATYPDEAAIARYGQLARWYHWRMAAYCLWKESRGDPNAAAAGAAELAALRAALAA